MPKITDLDRFTNGMALLAFSISMFSLFISAFDMAGLYFARWVLVLLGLVSFIAMILFAILGFKMLLKISGKQK